MGINIALKSVKEKTFLRHIWSYKKADSDGLRESLNQFDWNPCFSSTSFSEMRGAWTHSFLSMARQFIQNKLATTRSNDIPYYNSYLRKLKKKVI